MGVIEQHEALDAEAMARVHGLGSGGSELYRPNSQERRFAIAHMRATRAARKQAATRQPIVPQAQFQDTDEDADHDRGVPPGGAGGGGPCRPRQAGTPAGAGSDNPPGRDRSGHMSEVNAGGGAMRTTRAVSGGTHEGGGGGAESGGTRPASSTTPGFPTPSVFRPALPPEASLTTTPVMAPAAPATAAAAVATPAPSAGNTTVAATQEDIARLLAVVARQERLLQSLLRDKNPQQGEPGAAGSVLSDAASSPKRRGGPPYGGS